MKSHSCCRLTSEVFPSYSSKDLNANLAIINPLQSKSVPSCPRLETPSFRISVCQVEWRLLFRQLVTNSRQAKDNRLIWT